MDAAQALKEMLGVADEVREAVVFDVGGEPTATSLPDDEARQVASLADAMLAYAGTLRRNTAVRGVKAVTLRGDVYVARQGERAVVAVAGAGSTAGLVRHDLRMLLASLSRRPRRKAAAHAGA
jgi:predicted regulator of Ras-like GTPase activity (Roadblock/LC7/MglB family)